MRIIAIAWTLMGLGCMSPLAGLQIVQMIDTINRHDVPAPRPCASASGESLQRCRAATSPDQIATDEADDVRRAREDAEVRETGRRLESERASAPAREPSTCMGAMAVDTAPPQPSPPERLDPVKISEAVAKVKPQVLACRDRAPVTGQVRVVVWVAAGGCVVAVSVEATPRPAFDRCVTAALAQATFMKTESGGSFRYPFLF